MNFLSAFNTCNKQGYCNLVLDFFPLNNFAHRSVYMQLTTCMQYVRLFESTYFKFWSFTPTVHHHY